MNDPLGPLKDYFRKFDLDRVRYRQLSTSDKRTDRLRAAQLRLECALKGEPDPARVIGKGVDGGE